MARKKPAAAQKDATVDRPLTWFRYQLVKMIRSLGQDAYTNAVRRALNEKLGTAYEIGPVHATLERLREAGVLETYHRDNVVSQDGRRRTVVVYEVTPEGQKLMNASKRLYETT